MIVIKDIVSDTFTNSSGYGLFVVLSAALSDAKDVVILSFDGVSSTSSSFLNSSIGALVEKDGLDILKRIKPMHVGATQAKVLKKYIHSLSEINH